MSRIATLTNDGLYVIAEIGINHNGSLDEALYLMNEAAWSGADAVKFQKRNLSEIYVESLLNDPNSAEWSFQYLIPQLKVLELSDEVFAILRAEARRLGVDFIVTPFDQVSADFVAGLDLDAVKFSSADLTNWPLISHTLAKLKCPAIFSTGMWDDTVIRKSAKFIADNFKNRYAMLLCQSTYPAPPESLNLRYLHTLSTLAPMVGYSGHELGVQASLLAHGLGATIIEKHITRDIHQLGPDHKASLTPEQFRDLVRQLRLTRTMLGEDKKVITMAEHLNREVFAKSLVAKRDLAVGEAILLEDLKFMSPGKGITPDRLPEFLGKTLMRAKKTSDYITEQDFEKSISVAEWPHFAFSKDWGVKCRFHDFEVYKKLNTPVVEFHCSDRDVIEEVSARSDSSALIIHAPEIIGRDLFDLCSDNAEVVHKSVDILEKTIVRTRELAPGFRQGVKPKIVLHVGGMSLLDGNHDCAQLTAKAEKILRDVNLDGVELLPENLPPRPWYLGGQWHQYGYMRPEDMASFCKSLSLGMTFDICHAQLYCKYAGIDLVDYAKIVLPYTRHVHISDAHGIDGEGVQIDEGELDFDALFRHMEKLKFSWVPEIWSGHLNHGAGTHHALCCLEKYGHAGIL
jgi:sialic acid synthase SpsE/sugar phosphate isomerase/epimerase